MQWHQMPTFKKWSGDTKRCLARAKILISKFSSFSIGFVKSQKTRIAAYYSLLLIFYLFFWPVFNNWFFWNEQGANIDTQYYTCTLNEFTHKKDAECKALSNLCGEYDLGCHTIDISLFMEYQKCGVLPENCHYSIFNNECQCNDLKKLTRGLEKEAFLHDKSDLTNPPSGEVATDSEDGVRLIPTQTDGYGEVFNPAWLASFEYQECKKNNLPDCPKIVMDYLYGGDK